jgi:hypothetical protein
MTSAPRRPSQRKRNAVLVASALAVSAALVAVGLLATFLLWGGLSSGTGAITLPSQCHTALQTTTSCRGEDNGFQECHSFFRADGIPAPDVCRAFQRAASETIAIRDEDAGAAVRSPCDETSPIGWERIACDGMGLRAGSLCFQCASGKLEESRLVLQAFDATCELATVVRTCNVPLAIALAIDATAPRR